MFKEIVLKWRFLPPPNDHWIKRAILVAASAMEDCVAGNASKERLSALAQQLRRAADALDNATMPKLDFWTRHIWIDSGPDGEVKCEVCNLTALSRNLDTADEQGPFCREKYIHETRNRKI